VRNRKKQDIPAEHIQALADFRFTLRTFLHFSESAAIQAGLTAQQHQLLLQIAGARQGVVTTVGYLAERLVLRHHSVVELCNRCEEAGLVVRNRDPRNRRLVVLKLAPAGKKILQELSLNHSRELLQLAPQLTDALTALYRTELLDTGNPMHRDTPHHETHG
jgi:DNA-binding MarR family transcriptional regulator